MLPSVALPKGGGAVRGIGEKLSVGAATGTLSLSVPLALSPGRSGFGPALSLAYDSGAGNGPFGFGWSVAVPAIVRKTDKGLPRYDDAAESDVFVLSGAEDLVPVLDAAGERERAPRRLHGVDYDVHVYRPRIEGLFARIERWVALGTRLSHWRSIAPDGVVSLYGLDENSRITDPQDARKVFAYRLARTFDDTGNVCAYEYAAEDGAGVDLTTAHESNRGAAARTAQRYLKRVRYGNVQPYFAGWSAEGAETPLPAAWHFELVLDYGDHAPDAPSPAPDRSWPVRPDPFSAYRAAFEVRTYRRCRRVLQFHHFAGEPDVGTNCLVRSTDLRYSDEQTPADPRNPVHTFLISVTQCGYRRAGAGYLRAALPPLEFEYVLPRVQGEVLALDRDSAANVPEGIDGARYRFVDLDGEGASGILTDANGEWCYKRNLSPGNLIAQPDGGLAARACFGPVEVVTAIPSRTSLAGGQRLLDLTGDGRLDAVALAEPGAGFFERTDDASWTPLQRFASLPQIDWAEPNLRFVDVTGDGLADALLTEDGAFTTWASLGAAGFDRARRTPVPWDEQRGPHVVLADGTETIFLADMSGDGLSDIVRVRNGDVCYWPNLGYGCFGAKVAMDGAPRFTGEDRFDARRVRLADVDGSGAADLLYVGADGVRVWFNASGNAFADPHRLAVFPSADPASDVQVVDLLGTGTACLVWSSPWPGAAGAPLRYVDLMGGRKPHLLARVRNNLGAETRVHYAPSTRFYAADKLAGRPWLTRLHFPVQVVERVESFDWIGRSRFVTRYAYHHGYFDGAEREFRGFGMVEQWDTEEHRDDTAFGDVGDAANGAAASWSPPLRTRTWFHTGAFAEPGSVSRRHASEYWTEPALRSDARRADREAMLLPDTVLPPGLGPAEVREACRALKGRTLRTEVYADDGSARADLPYTVSEYDFTVVPVQPKGRNPHAVFFAHARESVTFHYERVADDPRVTHDVVLEADAFGNVLRSVAVAYPRRGVHAEPEPALSAAFRGMLAYDQARLHVAATQKAYTNAVADRAAFPDAHRAPLPCETLLAELTGAAPAANFAGITNLFRFAELDALWATAWDGAHDVAYEDVPAADVDGAGALAGAVARRIAERTRTLYRSDDLSALLALGTLEPGARSGESYRLALTPGLVTRVFDALVPDATLSEGGFVRLPGASGWWIPSGRTYHSAGDADAAPVELAEARAHFYVVRRAVDAFGGVARLAYDAHDLLPRTASDALGNTTAAANDYRVLQPLEVTDPNGNRKQVAFDALGHVVGLAVLGKTTETLGDTLTGFVADLDDAAVQAYLADPLANGAAVLGNASSRFVYDLFAYQRTRDDPQPQPSAVCTVARETHAADLAPLAATRYRHTLSYGDGFAREIQKKTQAKAGPVVDGGPDVAPRWIGSGWTIYDNKARKVRTYEPFFSATHRFEFARATGVASTTFYDPPGRAVVTLHPDGAWEKVVTGAWRREAWDGNDTVLIADPRTDADAGAYFRRLLGPAPGAFTSWHDLRIGGTFGATPAERAAQQDAAQKAAAHAATPAVTHLDPLGRVCLAVGDAGAERHATRSVLDPKGKTLAVIDALGRRAIENLRREPQPAGTRYVRGYDSAGNLLYQNTPDGGARRTLSDVRANAIRSWDARGTAFRLRYDALRRPTHRYASAAAAPEMLIERTVYGEGLAAANLCGRVFRRYDAAGVAIDERYDFKGNLVRSRRVLAAAYRTSTDWSALAELTAAAQLDAASAALLAANDDFTAATAYDALDRPVQIVTPHGAGVLPSVVQTAYSEAGRLDALDVWIRRATAPAAPLDPATADLHAVTSVACNARGQRTSTVLGNGSVTTRAYDPLTFRLTAIATVRGPAFAPDLRTVQALSYAYDPAGNVTRIRDDADTQNAVYFSGRRVDPTADFTYDALYRLARATGREHLGQTGGVLAAPVQAGDDDAPRVRLPHPGDGNALDTYAETYAYDAAGNLLALVHHVSSGAWTRRHAYAEPSRIVASETGNRLSSSSLPGDPAGGPYTARYAYDAHGNTVAMPHLPALGWDERDRLRSTTRQVVNAGTPETTWYAHDAGGERRRKATDRAAAAGATPALRAERIYLGGLELYREFAADGTTVTLQREALHVTATGERIALVETRTAGTDDGAAQLVRFQYGNHLGSALLELDAAGGVISYEEYFPYGSTAYQAVRAQTDTPKRYRYAGKERDAENGFAYHGARYYAPWLARWTSCDPAGPVDGTNVYAYARGNPLRFDDPAGTQSHDTTTTTPPPPPGTAESHTTMYEPDPDNPAMPHGYPPYYGSFGPPSAIYGNVVQSPSQPDVITSPFGTRYRFLDVELTGAGNLVLGGGPALPAGGYNVQLSVRFPITNLLAIGAYGNVGPSFAPPGPPTPTDPTPSTTSTTGGAQGLTLHVRSEPGRVGGGFYGQFGATEATGSPTTYGGAGTGIFQYQSSANDPAHALTLNATLGGGSGTSLLNTQPVGGYFSAGGAAAYTYRSRLLIEGGVSHLWAARSPLAPAGSNEETRVFAGVGVGGSTSAEDAMLHRETNTYSATVDVFTGFPGGALPVGAAPGRDITAVGVMLTLTIGFRIPLFSVGEPPSR